MLVQWCWQAELGWRLYQLDRAWLSRCSRVDQAALRRRVTLVWPSTDLLTVEAPESTATPPMQYNCATVCTWADSMFQYLMPSERRTTLSLNVHDVQYILAVICWAWPALQQGGISQACLTCHVQVVVTKFCTEGWPSKISFAGMKTQDHDAHKDTHKGNLSWITYPILYPSPQPIPDISLNKIGPSQAYILFSPWIYHTQNNEVCFLAMASYGISVVYLEYNLVYLVSRNVYLVYK